MRERSTLRFVLIPHVRKSEEGVIRRPISYLPILEEDSHDWRLTCRPALLIYGGLCCNYLTPSRKLPTHEAPRKGYCMQAVTFHLRRFHISVQSVVLIAVLLLLCGCAATKQARTVEKLGFLKDLYPVMNEGNENAGESLLIYKNPKVPLIPPNTYTRIMLDPVLIFRGPESKLRGISQDEAQLMADTFYALIYQELSKDYEMVDKPGPSTLRAQVAITHLEKSWPMLDVVSSVPAPMNVLAAGSVLKTIATGKPAFTGEAVIEAKVTDAETGEVLRAVVDRRVGRKKLDAESFNSWSDVYEALRYWAENARYQLCKARQVRTDCPKPRA
jgi:hypothetical protein